MTILKSVADPDLQIRGGGGGGHPYPEIRGAVSRKRCLGPFGPQFGRNIRGGPSPGSATENGGRTKPIVKFYATHGHEPTGSESTVGSESVSLER